MKLSFFAMLCGWIACNIAWWGTVAALSREAPRAGEWDKLLGFAMFAGFCMGVVVLAAWLLVFLPVDLLVRDGSTLRRPRLAALCGFLSALATMLAVFVASAWNDVIRLGFEESIRASISHASLPYALGTCATGTVAAYVRALMDKPKTTATP